MRGGDGGGIPHECETDDSMRWLGTYGDAVTLLMAFFVMLYAMSEVDAQKFDAFVSGLEGPFGNQSLTESILPSNTGIIGPNTPSTVVPDTPAMNPVNPLEALVGEPVVEEQTEQSAQQSEQLREVEQALESALGQAGLASVADYRSTTRGLVISIASDDVLFGLASTEISEVGAGILATLASVLDDYDHEVVVEGHTDDLPLRRVGYSNWNLSTDRAVAVVEQLVGRHGMAPERLGAAGYADQRPRVPNDSPAGRALNRRVDILIVAPGAKDG